jgi:uncharacterized protein YdbL (DUF1318 family)
MKHIFFAVVIAGACAAAASGCASSRIPSCLEIVVPEINMTGEKTVIERQIVGDYRELEKDAWMVSSVKTTVERAKGAPVEVEGDEVLYRAMKVREFNDDKIRLYKNEGVVGEAGTGYLVYMPVKKYDSDQDLRNRLQKILEDENGARRSIFERSVMKSGVEKPDADQVAAFGVRFAEEQSALAQKNDWIQDRNGRWVRKK